MFPKASKCTPKDEKVLSGLVKPGKYADVDTSLTESKNVLSTVFDKTQKKLQETPPLSDSSNQPQVSSLWKFISYAIRYGWMVILVCISEFLKQNNMFPDYVKIYQKVIVATNYWRGNDENKSGLVVIFVLAGPYLLEIFTAWCVMIIIFMISLLWQLVSFHIKNIGILVFIVIISEILRQNNLCENYTTVYRSILRQMNHWCGNDNVKHGFALIFVLTGLYLLEICAVWSVMTIKFIIYMLLQLVQFETYTWILILVVIISEILRQNDR